MRTFRIRALLRNEGPARVLDGNFVLMDIAAAQWAFDRLGRVDRVDVRLDEPSRLDEAERAIGARLPAGLNVQRPARRGQQVEQMLAAFQFNLAALSYVALLVGLFLVYNTVATSVIARRDEIGVLRALGTPQATVLALFLGEAAVLAAAGCLAGIPLGWALARAAVAFTSATVTTLYVAHAAAVPALTWIDAALAVGLGLPLALIAAAAPALEAARVSPLRAVRGGNGETDASPARWRWTAGGVACLLASAACSQAGPIRGLPIFGFLSAVLIVFGLAALVPAALTALAHVTGAPRLAWIGIETRLAHANLTGAIRRSERLGGGPVGEPGDAGRHCGDDRQLPRDGDLLGRADAARRSVRRDGAALEPRRAGHHLARRSSRRSPAIPTSTEWTASAR